MAWYPLKVDFGGWKTEILTYTGQRTIKWFNSQERGPD